MGIYKDCDIRGVYGLDLSDWHASRLGQAIGHLLGAGDVLVAGDGRHSTARLKDKLSEALVGRGCYVVDLGQVPTPVFYFARHFLGINTGVIVTASHNPAEDNGFKLILGALPVTPQEMLTIRNVMEHNVELRQVPGGRVEKVDILPEYLLSMRKQIPHLEGLKVVVDCANGMAAQVAKSLWQSTGAQAAYIFDRVDGSFPNHPPNPARPENLAALGAEVKKTKADLGVAYDGDGDRVAFVDAAGKPLSNDNVIVLFARVALKENPAPIVYDQKCSSIVREAIETAGGEPVMERSGHTFIKTSFIRLNAPYAGEISGHHFFRSIGGDDGVMASLFLSDFLVHSGSSLAELVNEIPVYPITPDIRIPMDEPAINRVLQDLQSQLDREARLSTLDGVRLEFEDGWGMARQSVTEPVITLRFEGKTTQALKKIMQRFEIAAPDLAGRLAL